MRKLLALATLGSLALAPTVAGADDKSACLDAVAEGQTLRDAHRLVEARAKFRMCAEDRCPAVVRPDCATWLSDVERLLPSVALSAKDAAGNDVLDARVFMDGKPLATTLDGHAVTVDPGRHEFRFERADGSTGTVQVLVKEGEKARSVTGVLAAPVPVSPPVAPPAVAPPGTPALEAPSAQPAPADVAPSGKAGGGMRIAAWIAGGAGVIGLGVSAALVLDAKSKNSAAAGESGLARQTDSSSAVQEANLATIVFGLGAAAVATGVVLWLIAPKDAPAPALGTNGREILVRGTF